MTSDGIGPKGPGGGLGIDRLTGGEIGDEAASVIELTGVIKWFDVSKGYGFIAQEDGSKDVFVHHSNIAGGGFKTLSEGAKVEFEVREGAKGPEAVNVAPVGS